MHTEFWWRNLKERDMEEQGVDVKISLDKQDGRTRTELARLRIRTVVGLCCEHGDKSFGFHKMRRIS